jgi:hypothetical protein
MGWGVWHSWEEPKKAYTILIGKSQVKRLPWIWGYNIKMNPVEVGYESVDESVVSNMGQS